MSVCSTTFIFAFTHTLTNVSARAAAACVVCALAEKWKLDSARVCARAIVFVWVCVCERWYLRRRLHTKHVCGGSRLFIYPHKTKSHFLGQSESSTYLLGTKPSGTLLQNHHRQSSTNVRKNNNKSPRSMLHCQTGARQGHVVSGCAGTQAQSDRGLRENG